MRLFVKILVFNELGCSVLLMSTIRVEMCLWLIIICKSWSLNRSYSWNTSVFLTGRCGELKWSRIMRWVWRYFMMTLWYLYFFYVAILRRSILLWIGLTIAILSRYSPAYCNSTTIRSTNLTIYCYADLNLHGVCLFLPLSLISL